MKIIIPMSGVGQRFQDAGYQLPKPLILVDDKPIIQHVVEMFSIEDEFVFICNESHLSNKQYKMQETLECICPTCVIVSISPHNLGPIHAVMQSLKEIDNNEPVIVNYCDFTCYWDYNNFKNFVIDTDADGVIPSYRGFHPHTLWSNYYAYVKTDGLFALDIQEKQPYTDQPRDEFASSGTYYFKTGELMQTYFKRCIDERLMVGNEYYVSMAYKPMMEDGLNVQVYELEYFMQWGAPTDLEEYQYWSDTFRAILAEEDPPMHDGMLLLPMAGVGSRFVNEGYTIPKPLIQVSSLPMAVQALNDLPITEHQRFIIRDEMDNNRELQKILEKSSTSAQFVTLDHLTDGQATTCVEGLNGVDTSIPITIAACDNGMIYSSVDFEKMMSSEDIDVIVWGARGYPGAVRSPQMYGWIDVEEGTRVIRGVSVKKPLSNPSNDPIVVGTFTFKKSSDFLDSVNRMKNRKAMVNGEYYVDTAINDAIRMGLKCVYFEIDRYICWGTPSDLKTFEYWQSCFHKWNSHPYKLENDRNIISVSKT